MKPTFAQLVFDVRNDPLFPLPNYVAAFFWTLWHWQELLDIYAEIEP